MVKNNIQLIRTRLKVINDKYIQPLPIKAMDGIKSFCHLPILPSDFTLLNNICRCDFFCFFDFYNFENKEGLIDETLWYRKEHNLPNNYLVLAQQDDVSFIVLRIVSKDSSEVIWCDYEDFFNLCAGKSFEYNPTIFPSFIDFYEFLLDEEEKTRAEQKDGD